MVGGGEMIRTVLIIILAFVLILFLISLLTSFPLVEFSWSTQDCVRVVYGNGSCENLPEKYQMVWVK
jgi:hypothetical protein